MLAYHICRARCNGSYTTMTKPMKTLELRYPKILFLINPTWKKETYVDIKVNMPYDKGSVF